MTALLVAAGMVLAALMVVWLSAQRTVTSPTAATETVPAPSSTAAGALTSEALLTPEDLTAVGLAGTTAVALDAPQFPVSCEADSWAQTWSAPIQGVGQDYQGAGAGITEYALGYGSAADAGAALDQLVTDAAACADSAGSPTATTTDTGLGDSSAVFRSDDGGQDGTVAVTWAVVTRSADTLLLTSYTTRTSIGTGSGPADGGDDATGDSPQAESTARTMAQAALDRFASR